ncbi:MAG: hypothetical protein ACLSGF_10355 [Alistipes onderdonkii]
MKLRSVRIAFHPPLGFFHSHCEPCDQLDIAIEQRAHFVGHYLVVGNDEDIFLAVLVFPGEGRVPGVVERKVALKQLSGNRNAVVQTRLARIDLGIEVKARQQGEGGFAGGNLP